MTRLPMCSSFKKILCFLTALLLVICAAGCTDHTNDPEIPSGSTQEESTAVSSDQSFEDVVIASNGKTDFTVWLAQEFYSDSEIKDQMEMIRSGIKNLTGATLNVKSDRSAGETDLQKPGILIGPTSFVETQTIETVLRTKDFKIGYSGNKILVYATSKAGGLNAISYFYNHVIIGQKVIDKTLLFTTDHIYSSHYKYGIDSIVCCDTELSEYRIVIPENATANETLLANNLRYYLYENYGYDFEIVSDAEPASDHEILIGNTARSNGTATDDRFAISAQDQKLQLSADGMLAYEALLDYVENTFLVSGSQKTYSIQNGFSYTATAETSLSDGTLFATESHGDIRIVFYNVYGYSGTCGEATVRQPLQKEIVSSYHPDVLGCQEYSAAYHASFTSMLKSLGYSEVETTAGTSNYTPLFYNADKLEIVKSGYFLYSGPNDVNSKSVTWAVFCEKESGKQFAVFNTHFMYNQSGIDGNAARESNAYEILELIQGVQNSYPNISVVMGGDLNSKANSSPHGILRSDGLKAAWDKAETKNDSSGHHDYATYDRSWGIYTAWKDIFTTHTSAIDHVYVSENTSVKSYVTLSNLYALWTSDHMPVLLEIDLP